MTLYDYVKSSPQARYNMVQSCWTSLLNDKDFTLSMQEELKQLLSLTDKLTEAVLYYNRKMVVADICGTTIRKLDGDCLNSRVIEYCYTIVKQYPELDTACYTLLIAQPMDIDFTYDMTLYIVNQINESGSRCVDGVMNVRPDDLYTFIAFWYNTELRQSTIKAKQQYRSGYNNYGEQLSAIVRYGTAQFVKSIKNIDECRELYQLITDSLTANTSDIVGHFFTSKKHLIRKHDELATFEREKLIKQNKGKYYKYNDEWVKMVTEAGFRLPVTPVDMIMRGNEHNNCVASYVNRHETGQCIILFNDTATCELRLRVETVPAKEGSSLIIMGTDVQQYKGRFNKNLAQPLELYNMRVDMVGLYSSLTAIRIIE